MTMEQQTLKFHRGELKFCAGHFTIFSETERERLHGHNYYLEASVTAPFQQPGITFDYRILRDKLKDLCAQLNSRFLIPAESPYLKIEQRDPYCDVYFNDEHIPFLTNDILLLPIANTTLEELSRWFIDRISEEREFIERHAISELTVRVFNGPDQSALAEWQALSAKV